MVDHVNRRLNAADPAYPQPHNCALEGYQATRKGLCFTHRLSRAPNICIIEIGQLVPETHRRSNERVHFPIKEPGVGLGNTGLTNVGTLASPLDSSQDQKGGTK